MEQFTSLVITATFSILCSAVFTYFLIDSARLRTENQDMRQLRNQRLPRWI